MMMAAAAAPSPSLAAPLAPPRPLRAPPRYSSSQSSFLTPPLLSVDEELWEALDVCLDEELEAVDDILHASSPFSPLAKQAPLAFGGGNNRHPSSSCSVARDGRAAVMHRVEARLRFLAADARATLSGEPPTYREVLLGLREALGATDCPRHLPTPDLEAELLHHALERRRADDDEDDAEDERRRQRKDATKKRAQNPQAAVRGWADRLAAGLDAARGGLASSALPRTLAQLGGAAAVSAVGKSAARLLAGQYLALARAAGGAAAAGAAQRAVVVAAARYSALRGALALLGPAMWGALALDLALRALGADHARVARAVFVLAQVRLVRTGGFVPPSPPQPAPSSPSPSSAAFSERLYGPLGPDGVRARAATVAATVPAEFTPMPGEDDRGGVVGGGGGGGSSDEKDDDDDDDDDDDEQWLWGVA